MSTLSVVQQLYNLSKEPLNREAIVRDQGCLPGLVMFLRNNQSDNQIITITLETLQLLCENTNNKIVMAKEPGLLTSLQTIIDSYDSTAQQIELSNNIVNSIKPIKPIIQQLINNNENINTSNIGSSTTTTTTSSGGTKSTTFSMLIGEKLPIKENKFNSKQSTTSSTTTTNNNNTISNSNNNNNNNNNNKPVQTYIFHIKGMNTQAIKTQVEECLLKTRGVISFMIDLHTYQTTIRTSLSTDEIKMTIRNNIGLSASLVVDGQEESESLPDYLPEPSKENCSSQSRKAWGWGSIISFGGSQDQQQKQSNNAGWGASISKALFG